MQFCPKCGAMLTGTNCSRCDYKADSEVKLETSEKGKVSNDVAVVTEGENEINPKVDKECPKCKHNEAFFWTKQTRSSDEAETKFYKCTKCKHTWREYR
ncbi:MAG: transcription factor S [archaeon]